MMLYKDKQAKLSYLDGPKVRASFAVLGKPSRDPLK